MRGTVYLKTTATPDGNAASLTISEPGPLGPVHGGDVIRYAIEDVPEDVTALMVLHGFRGVAPMRNNGREPSDPVGWTYRYAELRQGAILR